MVKAPMWLVTMKSVGGSVSTEAALIGFLRSSTTRPEMRVVPQAMSRPPMASTARLESSALRT